MKRAISVLLLMRILFILCTPVYASGPGDVQNINAYTGQFNDVPASSWYSQYVQLAYEYGLMSGVSDTSFSPDSNLSVAEALTIACRSYSMYLGNSTNFSDGNPWYQPYLDYALANKIISTSAYEFTAPVKRADFALFVSNALPDEALPSINSLYYPDIPDVSCGSPSGDAIFALIKAGILDDGYELLIQLHPDDTMAEFLASASSMIGLQPILLCEVETDFSISEKSASIYRLYNAGILAGNDKYGTFTPEANITRSAVAAIVSRVVEPSLRQTVTLESKPVQLVPLDKLANLSGIQKKASRAQLAEAYEEARKFVEPLAGLNRGAQLAGIALALRMIDDTLGSYSDTAPHYNDPYGYLVLHRASCAGCTRATGMCLNMLGIPYEHVNESQYTHQWTRINVNGTYWICDAFGLYCGPEKVPYQHPNV